MVRSTSCLPAVRYPVWVYRGITRLAALLPLATVLLHAYSVLTHEAIIDTAWDQNIKPLLLQRWLALPLLASYRMVFLGCAFLGVVGAILYLSASAGVEVTKSATEDLPHHISPATKKVVTKLAGLFSLDAFGGGFLTDASWLIGFSAALE